MLSPEIEEGNYEYKRYISSLTKERFNELSTQMNWRLNEGNGICYYFLGVNDDGSIYTDLTKKQIKYSIKMIKAFASECIASITKIETKKNPNWFKIEIVRNKNMKIYTEKRILLLGDTNTGKTTFLSYIIKNKLDTSQNKARNFIFDHKHELESGKSSSINYQYILQDNNKYVFMDTPGSEYYIKTQMKIILSLDYDLVLYFPSENKKWLYKDLFFKFFKLINIPILSVDLKSTINNFPEINMLKPYKNTELLKILNEYMIKKIDKNENLDLDFIVLKTINLIDIGWLISGYLVTGSINLNDDLYWYTNEINKIKINSIFDSKTDLPLKISQNLSTITLSCNLDKDDLKYGFISNKKYEQINKFKLKCLYKNKDIIPLQLVLYIDNLNINITKYDYNWIFTNSSIIVRNNIYNKFCICTCNDFYGIFKIFI